MVPPYFPGKLGLSSSDIALLDKQHIRKPTYDHPLPTMSAAEEMDNISVTQIYTGKDDGGEVTFEFNGKHIAVSVRSLILATRDAACIIDLNWGLHIFESKGRDAKRWRG